MRLFEVVDFRDIYVVQ